MNTNTNRNIREKLFEYSNNSNIRYNTDLYLSTATLACHRNRLNMATAPSVLMNSRQYLERERGQLRLYNTQVTFFFSFAGVASVMSWTLSNKVCERSEMNMFIYFYRRKNPSSDWCFQSTWRFKYSLTSSMGCPFSSVYIRRF